MDKLIDQFSNTLTKSHKENTSMSIFFKIPKQHSIVRTNQVNKDRTEFLCLLISLLQKKRKSLTDFIYIYIYISYEN